MAKLNNACLFFLCTLYFPILLLGEFYNPIPAQSSLFKNSKYFEDRPTDTTRYRCFLSKHKKRNVILSVVNYKDAALGQYNAEVINVSDEKETIKKALN
jgi:hypothetical protein